MKVKINELETNCKKRNISDLSRGINEFKRGYQPRSNLVKDENDDLLADSHNILNRWKGNFSHFFNVHRIISVRQIEIQTADPLITDLNIFELKIAIGNLKIYKSSRSDQLSSELIQTEGKKLWSEIHKLNNCIWNKKKLPVMKYNYINSIYNYMKCKRKLLNCSADKNKKKKHIWE
jgi:hypothetical protein